MSRNLIFLAAVFSLLSVSSIAQNVSSEAYDEMLQTILKRDVPETDVATVSKILDEYVILDAREKHEYIVSHLPNARWVGYSNFNEYNIDDIDKNAKILVYCSVGGRSENLARKLMESKYKNVQNLYGGIFEWVNQGHAVVDKNGNETEKIHAFEEMWKPWLTRGVKVLETKP